MRPFPKTDEGKTWFMDLLRRKGFEDVEETTQYAHCDVTATYKGEKMIFELKNRDAYFFTYMDAGLSKERYEFLRDCGMRAFYVCFWNDKWKVIDVKRCPPTGERYIGSRRTTRFGDTRWWNHMLVTWPLDIRQVYDY